MTTTAQAQPVVQLPTFGQWSVAQTRPNQEQKLADDLSAMGVGFFLPTIRRRGKVGRMECIRDYPLFPSYLFLRGSDYDVYCAKQTNRIVNVLHVTKQDQLQQELMDIAKAVASGTDLHRVPLTAGTAVRVASGPLMGVCGIVVGGQSHNRVLLTCSMLGSAVSVSVEGEILETVLQ